MHYANPLEVQHYDLARGLEFVALWIMLVFMLVLVFGFRLQYRLLNKYDALDQSRPDGTARAELMLEHIKQVIFATLGYQGETREREPLGQLTERWIVANFGKIFPRFAIFYFVYIWALILTTRALYIDPNSGNVHLIDYTSRQLFGFAMICLYIASNSIFDIASIFFTIRHLRKIQEDPRVATAGLYLALNLVYCFGFFVLSQIFSNLIWPLKTNVPIHWADRFFSPAIALWPYAFIINANATPPEYLHVIFPGQLLITGTVFLPTLVGVLLFAATAILIQVLRPLKSLMISGELAPLEITVALAPGQKPIYRFRCINAFTTGIASSLVAAVIFECLKAIISSS